MAIGSAVQRGRRVYIYDEKGRQLSLIGIGSNGPHDGLKGYTSSTLSIRRGAYLYTYDETGRQKSGLISAR
jgi:hypothetical protein